MQSTSLTESPPFPYPILMVTFSPLPPLPSFPFLLPPRIPCDIWTKSVILYLMLNVLYYAVSCVLFSERDISSLSRKGTTASMILMRISSKTRLTTMTLYTSSAHDYRWIIISIWGEIIISVYFYVFNYKNATNIFFFWIFRPFYWDLKLQIGFSNFISSTSMRFLASLLPTRGLNCN